MCDSDNVVNNTGIKNPVQHFEETLLCNEKNDGKYAYVLFKASWCGHCHKYLPEFLKYRELCKQGTRDNMIMVVVDCDTAKELCQEYGISGFPITLIFKIDREFRNKLKSASSDMKRNLAIDSIEGNNLQKLKSAMKKYSNL